MKKIIKKLLRKLLGIKPIRNKKLIIKNIRLPFGRMRLIHQWENPIDDGITIRSNFNRELYYKYLDLNKNITQ